MKTLNRTGVPLPLGSAFALGSVGTGIYSTLPSLILLFYMTSVLDLDPALSGLVIFAAKSWDVVTDPFVGFVIDRIRKHVLLLIGVMAMGIILCAVLFAAIFAPPAQLVGGPLTVYLLFCFAGAATGYTLFAIPYIASPAWIGDTAQARRGLVTARSLGVMGGVLVAATLFPTIAGLGETPRAGYRTMGFVAGASIVVAMSVCLFAIAATLLKSTSTVADTDEGLVGTTQTDQTADPADPTRAPSWGFLLRLCIANLLLMAATSVLFGGIPFVLDALGRSAESGSALTLLVLLTTSLIFIPVWAHWAHSRPGGALFRLSVGLLAGAAAASPLLMLWGGLHSLWVCVVVSGAAFAAFQLLPYQLLAEWIRGRLEAFQDDGARATGLLTSLEKLGLALGPLILGLIVKLQPEAVPVGAGLSPALRLLGSQALAIIVCTGLAYIILGAAKMAPGVPGAK